MAVPEDNAGLGELNVRVPFRARITPKGVWLFICILTTGTVGPIALARFAGVATTEDVAKLGEGLKETKAVYDPKIKALDTRVTLAEKTLETLVAGQKGTQESVDRGRAEAIANTAADRVSNVKRSREVRELVFERALDNLKRGYPVHSGLDDYLR